jgi:cytochrome c oxidase assembly factor CtaG
MKYSLKVFFFTGLAIFSFGILLRWNAHPFADPYFRSTIPWEVKRDALIDISHFIMLLGGSLSGVSLNAMLKQIA